MTVVIQRAISAPGEGVATSVPPSEEMVGTVVRACSPGALRQRFFLPNEPDPEDVLTRYRRFLLAASPHGSSVVAIVGGVPVGLLNLVVVSEGLVEAGLLVADAWQRKGIGTHLLTAELSRPRWAGWTVRVTVQPDNLAMRELLTRLKFGHCRLVSAERDQLEYEISGTG